LRKKLSGLDHSMVEGALSNVNTIMEFVMFAKIGHRTKFFGNYQILRW